MTTVPLLKDWFFLKPDFSSFKINPIKHPQYLFGREDCELRDNLLTSLKESTYSQVGYHAIIFGQAGRGKTHLANHLLYKSRRENLHLETIYVDCPVIPSPKSPVHVLMSQVLRSIPTETIRRVGPVFFQQKTQEWEDRIQDELQNPAIYRALIQGLTTVNPEHILKLLGWLGGEPWDGITLLAADAPKHITSERQLARNVGALGQVFLLTEGRNLIFLIDEAERLAPVTGGEHYYKWLDALREIFRREAVGLLLFIIARNRDNIPDVLQEEEIMSVIGANNIYPCRPYAQQQADSFLRQLLEHVILRDPVPSSLSEILSKAGEDISTFPFTQEAFGRFVEYHSIGENQNIPREIINSLEAAARRAISDNKRLIDGAVLQQVIQGNI
jgi:Cdc6-like AAA superfamily ATPase